MQLNCSNTVSGNASYPLQPPVKRKTKPICKPNLFIVGYSHIKRVERDLIIHHLSDKIMSLKRKKFDGADVRRIQQHLLDQIDSIIIHVGTNDISQNKLDTTQPHDLANKVIVYSNVCKEFGITKMQCPHFCLANI